MNNETLINAVTEISRALSEPSVFDIIAMIISALSLITTIIIIILNYRAVEAAKESVEVAQKSLELTKIEMQKTIDIQLYERRLIVANHISQNDYSDNIMEIVLLFGKEIYKKIKNIQTLIEHKNNNDRMYEKYYELLDQEEDAEEYYSLEQNLNDESLSPELHEHYYKRYKELDEKYKIMYDHSFEEEIAYDIAEICANGRHLETEIKSSQRELKKELLQYMRKKLSFDETLR